MHFVLSECSIGRQGRLVLILVSLPSVPHVALDWASKWLTDWHPFDNRFEPPNSWTQSRHNLICSALPFNVTLNNGNWSAELNGFPLGTPCCPPRWYCCWNYAREQINKQKKNSAYYTTWDIGQQEESERKKGITIQSWASISWVGRTDCGREKEKNRVGRKAVVAYS